MTAADVAGPWSPLVPTDAPNLMAAFSGTWCVAGGWAIDLFLGRQTRPHADLDLLTLQPDLGRLHEALPGWDLFGANSGRLTPWPAGSDLDPTTHDIWCCRNGGPWEFQLMASPASATEWIYRRNPVVRGPLGTLSLATSEQIPFLAPEIQLLYKSRTPRPKDEDDFQAVLPHLGDRRRAWLVTALRTTDPKNPWIDTLIQ